MKLEIDRNTKCIPTDFSWQMGLGNDHAFQMLRTDVCEHIKLAHEELGIKYIRFHGLFDDDLLVIQNLKDYFNFANMPYAKGVNELSFRQVANVLDNVLKCGVKPFVELSFMPSAIAKGKKVGLRYRNNIEMPRKMDLWTSLIEKFICFIQDRYGKEEVESWYFEVWNEPDLPIFFHGSQADYFHLYEATARTIKKINPALRVGGPSTSACKWIKEFKDFCEKNKVPYDFLTTHHYPGDGFGNSFGIKDAFRMIKITKDNAGTRDLGDTLTDYFFNPDVYKTWTRGILRKLDEKARLEAGDVPLFITEWNSMAVYSAPVHDEKYSAAFIIKSVMDLKGLMEGYLFWCCSDVFEELFILGKPFHGSYGIINNDGIPKPNFWAFKILSQLYAQRLDIKTSIACVNNDVEYAVFVEEGKTQILLYAQNFDYEKREKTDVEITINVSSHNVTAQRIDNDHCNPKAEWIKRGKPDLLSPQAVQEIKAKTRLISEPQEFISNNNSTTIKLSLCTNDVVLLSLE